MGKYSGEEREVTEWRINGRHERLTGRVEASARGGRQTKEHGNVIVPLKMSA